MEFIKCLIFCFADRVAELIRIAEGYFCEAGIGISSGLLTRMESLLLGPLLVANATRVMGESSGAWIFTLG